MSNRWDTFGKIHALQAHLRRLDEDGVRALIAAYDQLCWVVEGDGTSPQTIFDVEIRIESTQSAFNNLKLALGITTPIMLRREFWVRCQTLGIDYRWDQVNKDDASPPPVLLKRLFGIGGPAVECARLMKQDNLVSFSVEEREVVEREVPPGTSLGALGVLGTWCYYLGSRRALVVTVKETGEETDVGDWWSWLHAAPWFDGTLEVKLHDWSFMLPEKKYSDVNFHGMGATVARVLNALGVEDLPAVELRPDVRRDLTARAEAKPRPKGPYR
jgi:hypothetical protein